MNKTQKTSTVKAPKAPVEKAPKVAKAKAVKAAPAPVVEAAAPVAEAKVEAAPVSLPQVSSVTAIRVADGKDSKAVKKIVVVPEVMGTDGELDRKAMRAYLEVALGADVAKAARWYAIATAPRKDVAVDVKTGDSSAKPGWLVDRGLIEAKLPGLGIDEPAKVMTVVIA